LRTVDDNQTILGKGAFGTCERMDYRGISVAVKTYAKHVKASAVSHESRIISQFDHQGNVLPNMDHT